MAIKVEELWEQIVALEESDPPLQFLIDTELEITRIKSVLSLYKYRTLKADSGLKEALGDFRLTYKATQRKDGRWILSISVDYSRDRGGDREIAATQLQSEKLGDI